MYVGFLREGCDVSVNGEYHIEPGSRKNNPNKKHYLSVFIVLPDIISIFFIY